jgi:hypothetical protein
MVGTVGGRGWLKLVVGLLMMELLTRWEDWMKPELFTLLKFVC